MTWQFTQEVYRQILACPTVLPQNIDINRFYDRHSTKEICLNGPVNISKLITFSSCTHTNPYVSYGPKSNEYIQPGSFPSIKFIMEYNVVIFWVFNKSQDRDEYYNFLIDNLCT
jgi:hypothetical protein